MNQGYLIILLVFFGVLGTLFLGLGFYSIAFGADGDILTGGSCFSDSSYNGEQLCDKAQDSDIFNTVWGSDANAHPHWWKYDLGVGNDKVPTLLRMIFSSNWGVGLLKDFKLYGSDNDINWTEILSNTTANSKDVWQEFNVDTAEEDYRYFKLESLNAWDSNNYVKLAEIDLNGHVKSEKESETATSTGYDVKQTMFGLLWQVQYGLTFVFGVYLGQKII